MRGREEAEMMPTDVEGEYSLGWQVTPCRLTPGPESKRRPWSPRPYPCGASGELVAGWVVGRLWGDRCRQSGASR